MLRRQNTFDSFNENKSQNGQAANFCFLAPAIVAVVIASEYNENAACGTQEPEGGYTIDLVTFLNVAGYLAIAWGGFILVCNCFARCAFGNDEEAQLKCQQILLAPALCILLFNISWASVGLYMYDNEFTDGCKDTSIGKMILAWSIIQIGGIGLVLCCACCLGICYGAMA